MMASVFEKELEMIQDTRLRETVREYFQESVPEYFWEVPSSLSGKHHSRFDAGTGGLVRHTKMCVQVASELARLEGFDTINPDFLYAAMLMHDSIKNGMSGRHYRADHPRLAADAWQTFAESKGLPRAVIDPIRYAIAWHSGQWSGPSTKDNFDKPREYLAIIKCAHLADYVASRDFFDKVDDLF